MAQTWKRKNHKEQQQQQQQQNEEDSRRFIPASNTDNVITIGSDSEESIDGQAKPKRNLFKLGFSSDLPILLFSD